jgi:asparagine synthase (glutamine-hydrolysing)
MCGLTGIWAPRPLEPNAATIVSAMNDMLRARGPDSDGVWLDAPAGVALGHRRLAILDLSPEGHQPMASPSGRYVTVFNGEVYNYRAIRREVDATSPGTPWRGGSDTEVILAAFDVWGVERAVPRFIGMFALAVWDRRERRLHLVRDRLGIKPLCHGRATDGTLLFGSDLRAWRAYPAFDDALDRAALTSYVRFGYVASPRTIHTSARKVRPGTILTFDAPDAEPREHVYWCARSLAASARPRRFTSDEEAVETLDALLRDAVGLRMIADVPLGAFLSGGIDSSTVVALMQAQSSRPVRTFSIGNEQRGYDESEAAAAVARHLGTEHTGLVVTAREALAVVPELPRMFDEPFADSSQIPTYLVSRLARQHVTVALSGDGGDELFGGYNRHFWGPPVWRALSSLPVSVRARVAEGVRRVPPDAYDRWLARLPVRLPGDKLHKLASVLPLRTAGELYVRLQSQWADPAKVLRDAMEEPLDVDVREDRLARDMMLGDLLRYLPDDILTKVDRASMAVSLEARVPLLDHRVVELSWELPSHLQIRGLVGKRILRRVLGKRVPEALWNRPKMGFGVPVGEWLRGPLRAWAEDLLATDRLRREGVFEPSSIREAWDEHLSGRRNRQHELWTILMFQAWQEERARSRAAPRDAEARPWA